MEVPSNKVDGFRWLIEELGFQLIKLQRGQKIPVRQEKGWPEREEKRSFEAVGLDRNDNAGILTGRLSGIIVLDIDHSELFPKKFEVPDTFTVKTAKGYHHYYKLPEDGKDYRCRAKGASGFDIRADGGYIVAPWSRHPDGITYTIVNAVEIADAPQWLLDLSEATSTGTKKEPATYSVSKPVNFNPHSMNLGILEERVPEGKRSDQIWRVLHKLVEQGCEDEDIIYIFESYPEGIGEKYREKGGSRVSWLQGQLDKVRKEHADLFSELVEAKDQGAVDQLAEGIVKTIGGTKTQEESIRAFVNLLIAMYEGSVKGWYAIPIPVGGGKTQTLLHFIEWLYRNDKHNTFSISVAFEKIEEIDRAARWLKDRGVPDTFFQPVHSEVPNFEDVLKRLPDVPVVLHTHQRLTGSSYIQDCFKFKGATRKLLVYDESMLNALIHSESSSDISSKLSSVYLQMFEIVFLSCEPFTSRLRHTKGLAFC